MRHGYWLGLAIVLSWCLLPGAGLSAQEDPTNESLKARLESLERALEQQQKEIELLRRELLLQQRATGVGESLGTETTTYSAPASTVRPTTAQAENEQQPVGQPPPEEKKERLIPDVQAIPELGGVLTPAGALILEPTFQYSQSQVNTFTFQGIAILDTFLIGILEVQDADRDLFSPQITGRLGLTDRLELELKIPYIYRDDRLSFMIPQVDPNATFTESLSGDGLGDIEVAVHYQINQGLNSWPFFVGNLRYKADNGRGPFDVDRDSSGRETELATGSGFMSVEPSITVLVPSDPAVFFGNVGYLYNISKDVNETFGDQTIGTVDPGDAIRINFGMAYAINEISSFTLGYKHDFIMKTTTEVNGVDFDTNTLDVGAALVGFSYQLADNVGANLNMELGVTEDAPDVVFTLRIPIQLNLF